jgi:serine/threonine-protein kinase
MDERREPEGERGQPEASGGEREHEEELRALARLLRGGEEPGGQRAPVVAGRFELGERIGAGAHGQVFRARDRENQGRALALKRLTPEASARAGLDQRLEAHGARLRELSHEGIVRLRAAGRDAAGQVLLASDLVDGESLEALRERRGALPPRQALEIARQTLAGLELGHARGLAHGALHARNVLLASRTPWSAENPFGVGVRLTDYGLAELLGEEPVSPVQDLFALGRLTAELVTGTRLEPDARDWPATGAALPDRELRALLDRALAADPARRFGSAREFRAAIEASRAWRPVPAARPRRLAWLAAALALVLLVPQLAWFELERRREVRAAPLAPELEREIARLDQETKTAAAEKARLEEELQRLEAARAELLEQTRLHEERSTELEDARRALAETLAGRESELSLAREDLELLRRRDRPQPGSPAELACYTLDRVLDRIAAGDPAAAQAAARAARDEPELAELGLASEFLSGGLEAALLLVAAPAPDELARARSMLAARDALARAAEERERFLLQATPWIEADTGQYPDRRARLLTWFDGLTPVLEQRRRELDPGLEARWRALVGDPGAGPAELLLIARWFDDGRLAGQLARLSDEFTRLCAPAERLELEPLRSAASLEAWGELALTEPALGAEPAAAELLRLAFARRFVFPAEPAEALPPWPLPLPPPGEEGAPRGDWREALRLRQALLAPGSAFPGRMGSVRLYRARSPGGEESWIVEQVRAEPDGTPAGVWLVAQTFHDSAGSACGTRTLTIERRGKRFLERDVRERELVDLAWDRSRVRAFAPEPSGDPPARLGFAPSEVGRFRTALESEPAPALVIEENGEESWFAAGLGLVRYRSPDRIVRELVHVEGP